MTQSPYLIASPHVKAIRCGWPPSKIQGGHPHINKDVPIKHDINYLPKVKEKKPLSPLGQANFTTHLPVRKNGIILQEHRK